MLVLGIVCYNLVLLGFVDDFECVCVVVGFDVVLDELFCGLDIVLGCGGVGLFLG